MPGSGRDRTLVSGAAALVSLLLSTACVLLKMGPNLGFRVIVLIQVLALGDHLQVNSLGKHVNMNVVAAVILARIVVVVESGTTHLLF